MTQDVVAPDRCIWGLPGTGKTTELMRVVQEEIQGGVPADAIVGVTFRRAMASEFKDRAEETIGGSLDDGHWFRTTHSACFRLLDLSRDDVVQDSHLSEVAGALGVDYSGAVTVDDVVDGGVSGGGSGDSLGDQLFNMYSRMRNAKRDPRESWRDYDWGDGSSRLSQSAVENFIGTYEDYKADRGLYDFEDMLEGVVSRDLCPPRRVLIEDEFQDKTPLQVDVYNSWAEKTQNVYVAGDRFQSIYSFIGTDPSFMEAAIETADETTVLDTSYRFGPEVWEAARRVLSRAGYGSIPQIEASGSSSAQKVSWDGYRRAVDHHRDDECLHLVRANYLASDVVDVLAEAGVPFTSLGGTSFRWSEKMVDLYNGVVAMADTAERMQDSFGYVNIAFGSLSEARRVIESMPASNLEMQKKEASEKLDGANSLDDIRPSTWVEQQAIMEFGETSDPFSLLNDSAVRSGKERLTNAWGSMNGQRMDSIDHRVSSIHGAKGSEASSVFLLDGSTRKIEAEADPKEEARVWFVGATRAADNLYVVSTDQVFKYGVPVGVA